MEFKIEELSIGNMMLDAKDRICRVEELYKYEFKAPAIVGGLTSLPNKPMPLTKEILRDNLGFEISDMGDFWQCQKEDFVLIQIKLSFGNMPYMFMLKSSIKESVNFYYVHHLQNTYLDLKGELLLWKS